LIGLNFVIRKAAVHGSPTHVITVDGDNIKIDIDAGLKKCMSYAPLIQHGSII